MTTMGMATMGMPICWFCCWEDVRWEESCLDPVNIFLYSIFTKLTPDDDGDDGDGDYNDDGDGGDGDYNDDGDGGDGDYNDDDDGDGDILSLEDGGHQFAFLPLQVRLSWKAQRPRSGPELKVERSQLKGSKVETFNLKGWKVERSQLRGSASVTNVWDVTKANFKFSFSWTSNKYAAACNTEELPGQWWCLSFGSDLVGEGVSSSEEAGGDGSLSDLVPSQRLRY